MVEDFIPPPGEGYCFILTFEHTLPYSEHPRRGKESAEQRLTSGVGARVAPPQRESARGLLGFVVRARVCSLAGPAQTASDSAGKVAGACGTRGVGPGAGPGQGWGRARAAGLLPLLLGQLLALTGGGGAFYLEVSELEEKCFIQEIPDGTVVIGNYKTELYDPATEKYQPSPQWINLFVFVKDPENKNLLARQYGPRGSFTFTSQSPGEHQICLHLESIRFALFYDGKLAIHLDMQLGEHTNDYTELAANDKLTLLHLRIQQLVEQVEKIQKEQEYQRWREERFRQTSESTNQRVLWWFILQTFILVATGIWQMQHLKSFFKAKKLV
ncbi:transmembrane emp24 domain-containing protein 9-like [Balaenoptera musculus]|uniref:Transmembrane emp24 domain-containing protein 9-like n=1 Tax=Balaenoptera musculus TaxID=9771 RepID=A0A8B8X0U0_BALMU|nr:transmembrane emp24 domain-containing protein 9-like [Balaenoptera musculus]